MAISVFSEKKYQAHHVYYPDNFVGCCVHAHACIPFGSFFKLKLMQSNEEVVYVCTLFVDGVISKQSTKI
jgi:hypothetical protein